MTTTNSHLATALALVDELSESARPYDREHVEDLRSHLVDLRDHLGALEASCSDLRTIVEDVALGNADGALAGVAKAVLAGASLDDALASRDVDEAPFHRTERNRHDE